MNTAKADRPTCGVIMPISQTANHSEAHWQSVQTLIHRAITIAGFQPQNVWENTSTDRISERIIGNIFQVPLAIADITDLNPNVMLELGLRLASKRPTVVIATTGSAIPFDIRDFHASFYPADTNMLDMEDFFRRIGKILNEKLAAVSKDNYTPFLGSVIVDVVSPETREVGVNDLLLSRLEDISNRLTSVETSIKRSQVTPPAVRTSPPPSRRTASGHIEAVIPTTLADEFKREAVQLYEVDSATETSIGNDSVTFQITYSQADSHMSVHNQLSELAERFGGEVEIPF